VSLVAFTWAGMMGVAVDPAFDKNRQILVYSTP
jgi:hypothetical protein